MLFLAGLLLGGMIGAMAMALCAMSGMIARDDEIEHLRRRGDD